MSRCKFTNTPFVPQTSCLPTCPKNRCQDFRFCTCCPGSPLLFSGFITIDGVEKPPVYATLGFGITAQASLNAVGFPGALIGQSEFSTVIPPLLLPLQFTASNPKPEFDIVPSTTPQDIYVRIPGIGQRFLRGLRMSIEYPTALAIPPLPPTSSGPMTVGIWAGSVPDGTTPPVLAQTSLTVTIQAFAQGNNSRFQSASNLTSIVPVQGGDYIAMVVYYPTVNVGPTHPYVEASVELI